MSDPKPPFDNVISLLAKLGKTVKEHGKAVGPDDLEIIQFKDPLSNIGFCGTDVALYYTGEMNKMITLNKEDAVRLGVALIQAACLVNGRTHSWAEENEESDDTVPE